MLMTSIRDYIQLKGRADLQDIARHFRIQETAVEPMLKFWINKGVISQIGLESNDNCRSTTCSDCLSCNTQPSSVYVWNHSNSQN